jgi:BirA family biotin operon repressor/biotin-[acetyl-CoA-carboxylase] ligase
MHILAWQEPMAQIDVAAVQANLATAVLGRPLIYRERVASTQDIVRAAANAGAPEGLAVFAGHQVAGRGRAGRTWWSPPGGGLYLSLLLRPSLSGERLPWVTMCLALGTAEAVEQVCGLRPDLKWPNDLEIRGRKLAGILAEGVFGADRLDFVVAGLGLNASVDFDSQLDLQGTATSLQQELGRPVDVAALLVAILERTDDHYLALRQGTSPLPAWSARLVTLHRGVEAHMPDGRLISGTATGVLPDGALRIRLSDGREEILRAVDVTLRHEH